MTPNSAATSWRVRPQPALFELKDDARPKAERTAAGRYQEPTLLEWLSNG